jgi:hypothetical protein
MTPTWVAVTAGAVLFGLGLAIGFLAGSAFSNDDAAYRGTQRRLAERDRLEERDDEDRL